VSKINQVNVFPDKLIQTEMENIYQGFQRIGFGSTTGQRAENLDAYCIEVTAASGSEFSASHDLKRTPFGFMVIGKNVSGDVWDGGTTNTESAIYLKVGAGGVYRLIVI
jgi:hypothetical protein